MKPALILLGALLFAAPTAFSQVRETPLVVIDDAQVFSDMAISTAMFGSIAAEVALERTRNDEVRHLAERMASQQSEFAERLSEAAQTDAMQPATAMSPRHVADADALRKVDAAMFDDTYLSAQNRAHDESVTLYEGFAAAGQSGKLRDLANELLPLLVEDQAQVRAMLTQ